MGFEPVGLNRLRKGKTIPGSRVDRCLRSLRAVRQVGKHSGGDVDPDDALYGLFEGVQSAAGHHQAGHKHQVEADEEPLRPAATRLVDGFLGHAARRYQRTLWPPGAP